MADSFRHLIPGLLLGNDAAISTTWFDIAVVRSNVAVLSGKFEDKIDVPEARAMNYKLAETKSRILGILEQLTALTDQAVAWKSKIPEMPGSAEQEKEANHYQRECMKLSLNAQNRTIEARNLFIFIVNSTRSLQQELEQKINWDEAEDERLIREKETAWDTHKRDGMNLFVPTDQLRPAFDDKWRPRFQDIEGRIQAYQIAMNTNVTYGGQAQTWQKLFETVNSNLGDLYNMLSVLRIEVAEDAPVYQKIVGGPWQSIKDNCNEVRGALGS